MLQEIFHMEPSQIAKNTIREAARMALVANAERWIGYINARNETSHTYDSDRADAVFERIPAFLPDARDLLKKLTHAAA